MDRDYTLLQTNLREKINLQKQGGKKLTYHTEIKTFEIKDKKSTNEKKIKVIIPDNETSCVFKGNFVFTRSTMKI